MSATQEALERLVLGNKRYVDGDTRDRDFKSTQEALTRGQTPYACILSCADSRISPEFCFDEERGDLFVNRVAGNYVSLDILASLEYGTAVLKAQLIMVLGHSGCGAIQEAIKVSEDGKALPGHLHTITSNLAGAVEAGKRVEGDLVDAVTRENIRLNVERLRASTPILRQLIRDDKLAVVGGLYHLHSGAVEVID